MTDRAWRGVERLLDWLDPHPATGRPRINPRRILNGILFRKYSGCPWGEIPGIYGDDATIHRTFRRWRALGVLDKIDALVAEAERDETRAPVSRPASRRRPRSPRKGSRSPRGLS